jgi:KaiC/GvpD/RAD55 family RecA-like ATPase
VRDINGGTNAFVAPPYIANYTDDVVANDIMRITAMLFYQKVSVGDIQDIVGKITRYYNKEGLIDLNRASLDDLMNRAIYTLNQNMAAHSAQTALKYIAAEDIGRDLVKMDLQKGLIKTFIEPIDEAMYGGLMPGNFYGLIGLGGTYKSIIAQSIAYKNAVEDVPTLYVNSEMSAHQFYERLIWQALGIDLRQEMYHKRLNEGNIDSFIEQLQVLTKRNIFVFNGSNHNRDSVLATVQHIEATTGKTIRLIVMDGISQMDAKGKEEIQAAIFNANECKEISKQTNAVVIGLLHMSGDAGAATLRDTGIKVRGGIKMTSSMDGYFSTSKLVDPVSSSLENTEEIVYLEKKIYFRLTDKRTRAGVVPVIVNITDRLSLEHEESDPRSYELNPNRKN